MSDYFVIYVTCPDFETAEKLGSYMVSNRYAACVNIVPSVKSIYWWEGEVQKEDEVLLIFKTKAELFSVFEENIKKHHAYSVPEVIAVRVEAGNREYLSWIEKETISLKG